MMGDRMMRLAIVFLTLATALVMTLTRPAQAQLFGQRFGGAPGNQPPAPAPNPTPPAATSEGEKTEDAMLFQSGEVLPAPLSPEEISGPTIALPAEPIDPYLLTRQAGPFMVMAHTFRGDHAAKHAQALAMELRREHQLPAYVFFLQLKPGGSNIRGVAPTTPRNASDVEITSEEAYRIVDEAAVLIGNFPSIADAKHAWTKIKKIHPRTLQGSKSAFFWRDGKGLKGALVTANPLLPSQDLYPGRPAHGGHHHAGGLPLHNGAVVDPEVLRSQFVKPVDPLVIRMNQDGPYSIFKCPAPYTLVVAEFSGWSSLNPDDPRFTKPGVFKKSPLQKAALEAEELADSLAKHPQVQALGVRPYIYHDRTSSRVTLGAYQTPNDPAANQVRQAALQVFVEERKDSTRPFLAPASDLLPVPRPDGN